MPAALTPITRTGVSQDLNAWVEAVAQLTRPTIIHWCTGTPAEAARLQELMTREGTLLPLDSKKHPGSFYVRSQPTRTDASRTLLCSRSEAEAGPSNCWADPVYMQDVLTRQFDGCMQGRVMYVVPYLLGPAGSRFSQPGVQITDSALAAYATSVVAQTGNVALQRLRSSQSFFKGLHSLGTLDPEQRIACLFPEHHLALSHGSNHLDDMLAARLWHGLKQRSITARQHGGFAEHMAVLGITSPDGVTTYLGVAGPQGCGKSTLAQLVPPDHDLHSGWRLELISDDITWLNWHEDGQLYAINPERGLLGLLKGVNQQHNAQAVDAIAAETVFCNTGFTLDRRAWWDGASGDVPSVCSDWRSREWTPSKPTPASHPESRFLTPLSRYPALSKDWSSALGVPLSAILFCSRRSATIPLVHETFDWNHGVYVGATLSSEPFDVEPTKSTPAAFEPMGLRQDCGYHLADYWQHWLNQGRRAGVELPRIYHVNWYRRDWTGKLMWPGYRENFSVLKWIVERLRGRGDSLRTPLGIVPTAEGLGLHLPQWPREVLRSLLEVEFDDWYKELDQREEFLVRFSTKLPPELLEENEILRRRIRNARKQSGR